MIIVDDVVEFFPDWGHKWPLWHNGAVHPEQLCLDENLSEKLAKWVQVWQEILDPVFEVKWPDAEVGRAWILEGGELCAELQRAVKKLGITVIPSFSIYSPDASE